MQLKIVTFNLRFDKPDPGELNWRTRREAIATLITDYAPHLIGTQEGKAHQLLDLHRLLPDYQSIGRDRTGTDMGEYCAIFYHSQYCSLVERGDFSLSDTPEVPGSISPQWGNPVPRIATWAKFSVRDEPKTITLFNTHLDYHSATARELGAKLICHYLTQLDRVQTYLFLTGDFNSAPGTPPRESLHLLGKQRQLNDALADLPLEQQLTFHDFTGKGSDAVDTIYYDSRLRLQSATVDTRCWQKVWPSDHFPVIAEFST